MCFMFILWPGPGPLREKPLEHKKKLSTNCPPLVPYPRGLRPETYCIYVNHSPAALRGKEDKVKKGMLDIQTFIFFF